MKREKTCSCVYSMATNDEDTGLRCIYQWWPWNSEVVTNYEEHERWVITYCVQHLSFIVKRRSLLHWIFMYRWSHPHCVVGLKTAKTHTPNIFCSIDIIVFYMQAILWSQVSSDFQSQPQNKHAPIWTPFSVTFHQNLWCCCKTDIMSCAVGRFSRMRSVLLATCISRHHLVCYIAAQFGCSANSHFHHLLPLLLVVQWTATVLSGRSVNCW